eukprot:7955109-Pyramimonas_sp.AAC.1
MAREDQVPVLSGAWTIRNRRAMRQRGAPRARCRAPCRRPPTSLTGRRDQLGYARASRAVSTGIGCPREICDALNEVDER